MKITNFGTDGLPQPLGAWSTGVVSTASNALFSSAASNTLAVNGVTVTGAAASNYHILASSSTAAAWVPDAGGGGTVSAGSNSTRVREVSTAGASTTLWSPFDHAHDGIGTITASSSNTMQRGTWNIRPGVGIALSLTDTDGDGEFDTATIVNTGVPGPAGTGGVGSTSTDWWHADNAPGSPNAANREFDSALADTRVAHGTPKGTWAQADGGAIFTQTATLASDLDVWAIARTCSVGDYVTLAFYTVWDWPDGGNTAGPFVGFSDGTTFGTSTAFGGNAVASSPFAFDTNKWTGHNSRGGDLTLLQVTSAWPAQVWGMRVKYEAANTWGLYCRAPGGLWRTISTTINTTLTPTHVVYGFGSVGGWGYTTTRPQQFRLECFRVND